MKQTATEYKEKATRIAASELTATDGLAECGAMAKGPQKPKQDDEAKAVSQTKAVRIHKRLQAPAKALAEKRARDVTQLINDLLLKELEAEKLWPTEELVVTLKAIIKQIEEDSDSASTKKS